MSGILWHDRRRWAALLSAVLCSCFSEASGDDGGTISAQGTATTSGGVASSESTIDPSPGSAMTNDDAGSASGEPITTTGVPGTTTDESDTSSTDASGSSSGAGETTSPDSSGTGAVCGDGVADPGEQCDGEDLNGATCVAGQIGPPICTDTCTVDVSPCCKPTGSVCVLNGSDCCSGSCGLDLECN